MYTEYLLFEQTHIHTHTHTIHHMKTGHLYENVDNFVCVCVCVCLCVRTVVVMAKTACSQKILREV